LIFSYKWIICSWILVHRWPRPAVDCNTDAAHLNLTFDFDRCLRCTEVALAHHILVDSLSFFRWVLFYAPYTLYQWVIAHIPTQISLFRHNSLACSLFKSLLSGPKEFKVINRTVLQKNRLLNIQSYSQAFEDPKARRYHSTPILSNGTISRTHVRHIEHNYQPEPNINPNPKNLNQI